MASSSLFVSCSWKGVFGAASLVLVTTLDDCVWLVPFVVSARTQNVAVLHALCFLGTLVGLATLLSVVTYVGVKTTVRNKNLQEQKEEEEESEFYLQLAAAVLCWLLALYLIYKKWQKRRRKRLRQQEQQQEEATLGTETTPLVTPPPSTNDADDSSASLSRAKPLLVMSLTLMGFLDELAYFPSLILGGIFSALELCLGTLLAGLVMLGIVTLCLAPCKPLIEWLDRNVPLYAVVTIFAMVLTIEVVVEALS